jgi:hypothetical protein
MGCRNADHRPPDRRWTRFAADLIDQLAYHSAAFDLRRSLQPLLEDLESAVLEVVAVAQRPVIDPVPANLNR